MEGHYKGRDVAVVFGGYFISDLDLPFRVKEGIVFEKYNRETFHKVMSEEGYIDYSFSEELEATEARL